MREFPKYIFSDFDGTISKYDVIHSFISNFSKGDWTIAEKQWSRGEISSKECLDVQMALIRELTRKTFDDFINSVEIDEDFIEFYNLSKAAGREIIILSDGFDYFIKEILKRYRICDIKIFSNHVILGEKDGYMTFEVKYPYNSPDCKIRSGTCKCKAAKSFADDYIYIGDGLSDRCIANTAKLLFAKKGLEEFCKKNNIKYNSFKTFKDIANVIYKGSAFIV